MSYKIEIPEEIIIEGKIKKGRVIVTSKRVVIGFKYLTRSVELSSIKALTLMRDPKWKLFALAVASLVSSVFLYGDNPRSDIYVLPLAVGVVLLIYWWVKRSFVLVLTTQFGREYRIISNTEKELIKIFNAIETRLGLEKEEKSPGLVS